MAQTTRTQTHSVLDALTQPNPSLRECGHKNTKNTTSEHFLELSNDDIGEWTDFNYENLYAAYADILSASVARRDTYISDNDSQSSIQNEEGLDYWMNTCITRELREPLKVTAVRLQARQNLPFTVTSFHGRGSNFTIPNPSAPQDLRQAFKPDWVVYQCTSVEKTPLPSVPIEAVTSDTEASQDEAIDTQIVRSALVFGDSKLTHKWKSSDLGLWSTLSNSQRKNLLLPLRQLATYCHHGRTRYGFLVTSTELVAMMLYMKNGQVRKLRYRSVPWHAYGQGLLTVKLSIFFLVAMALNPLYLSPEIDDEHAEIPNLMLFFKLRSLGDQHYGHPISGLLVQADRSQVEYGRASDPPFRLGSGFGYRLKLPLDPRSVSFLQSLEGFEELHQLSLTGL